MKFSGKVANGITKKMIKFWWRYMSSMRIRMIRIHIAILIRRALAEVCGVPVLLVLTVVILILCKILEIVNAGSFITQLAKMF